MVVAVLTGLAGCGPREEPGDSTDEAALQRPDHTFSVLSYNLGGFTYLDRNGDGQAAEMKPASEQEAVFAIISSVQPDILALQEMGPPEVFEAFRDELAQMGLDYPFQALVQQEGSDRHLALLSRFPLQHIERHTADRYRAGQEELSVKRGFLEAELAVTPTYRFRLFIAQLKSKAFHPAGQTEMRRSEARLLGNHIRRAQQQDPRLNMLVVGDFNDHIGSAPLRLLLGNGAHELIDLRPMDKYGEIWTGFDPEEEVYHRHDYALAHPRMVHAYRPHLSSVVRHPLNAVASHRRPLLLVFDTREGEPAGRHWLPDHEWEE